MTATLCPQRDNQLLGDLPHKSKPTHGCKCQSKMTMTI